MHSQSQVPARLLPVTRQFGPGHWTHVIAATSLDVVIQHTPTRGASLEEKGEHDIVARSKKTTALAVAAGVLTLGAGVGVATLASADPTPSPSTSPNQTAPAPDLKGGPGGHRGQGGRGEHGPVQHELAKTLASKLGVTEAKVTGALKTFREESKPTGNPTPGAKPTPGAAVPDSTARDAAMAKSLAKSLGLDQAKVTTALDEIRAAAQGDRAAALKTKLDAAVKEGTLTQADADAVTKAVDQGVINVGPR